MTILVVETEIAAPIELCFDRARDIDLHCRTAAHTQERAVSSRASGLLGPGDTVTFEGVHFGIRQRLTAKITEYDRPRRFVDEMAQGAFRQLKHTHEFKPSEGGTLMQDTLEWVSPFGIVGRLADALFLKRHMRNFLEMRNRNLKAMIESEEIDQ